jgi:hypothetical protein
MLTLAASVGLVATSAPSYEARASVLLLPGQASFPQGANVFLFMGGLGQARDVLVQTMNADTTREQIAAAGQDYSASPEFVASAPIIVITATGDNPSASLEMRARATTALAAQLTALQDSAGTPVQARITSVVLSEDVQPRANTKARTRALIAVGLLGSVLTMIVAAMLDHVLLARDRRKGVPGGAGPGSEVEHGRTSGAPDPGPVDRSGPDVPRERPDQRASGPVGGGGRSRAEAPHAAGRG